MTKKAESEKNEMLNDKKGNLSVIIMYYEKITSINNYLYAKSF